MDDQLKQSVLNLHEFPVPGKIRVSPTKPLATQHDLVPAYPPGAAAPCLEIKKGPLKAYKYTAHDNLVAVTSNGTAMLGLDNIGALAGKPVVEGRDVLFRKFVGIDILDIEVDELDPDKFIEVATTFEPTFGGINLEDTKAPECFYIEQKLRGRMNIPAFHDDQHGTAIISTAATLSDLRVVEKSISDIRMVISGVGAATIACMNLLVALGLQKHSITVCDSEGVIYQDRKPNMTETKAAYAVVDDGKRTLGDVIEGADIFPDCSGSKVLTQGMVKKTAHALVILALANSESEILLLLVKEVRPDAIVCTGRSDYLNQVNSVLCFPLIFRNALDVGTTVINEEMKLAAVCAIAELAHVEQSEMVTSACGDQNLGFGLEYITPESFDPRLIVKIAPAVVKAAMESGMMTHPIVDFDAYIDKLTEFVYKANLFMKPIFSQARRAPKHVILPEGEEARVPHATQELATLGLAKLTLIGRPNVIEMRIQKLGLQIRVGVNFEVVNNEPDPRSRKYWIEYFQIVKRRGVTQGQTRHVPISSPIMIDAIMAQRGEADTMVRGTVGDHHEHFGVVKDVLGYCDGVHTTGAMNALLLSSGSIFIADTYVNGEPDVGELAEITLMAAGTVRRFGIEPRVALLSHFNFGPSDCPSSSKIRQALELVRERVPELTIDGEMHGDATSVEAIRNDRMPDSSLKGPINTLMMPNMEAVHVNCNLLCISGSEGVAIGPVLTGMAEPVHVLTLIILIRHIVDVVALAVVEAQTQPLQFFFNSHAYPEYSR